MPKDTPRAEPLPGCPVTPDGPTNPALLEAERQNLTKTLMAARRSVAAARNQGDTTGSVAAHAAVDQAKRALGEPGGV